MLAVEILNRCRDGAAEVQILINRYNRLMECGAKVDAEAEQARKRIEDRQRRLDAERVASCRIVDTMPEPECTILYRYFVLGQSQGGIVESLHYSVGYYKKKKRSGLDLAEVIPDDTVRGMLPEWYQT